MALRTGILPSDAPQRAEQPGAPRSIRSTPQSVLVVDDAPNMVFVVTRLLAYDGVYAVGAANGVEALAAAASHRFDLILCDVRMPVMDGPTMLRELQKRGGAVPPVIFLTAHADHTEAELLALGACAVRNKPLDVPVLFDLVRAHLRAPTRAAG